MELGEAAVEYFKELLKTEKKAAMGLKLTPTPCGHGKSLDLEPIEAKDIVRLVEIQGVPFSMNEEDEKVMEDYRLEEVDGTIFVFPLKPLDESSCDGDCSHCDGGCEPA